MSDGFLSAWMIGKLILKRALFTIMMRVCIFMCMSVCILYVRLFNRHGRCLIITEESFFSIQISGGRCI